MATPTKRTFTPFVCASCRRHTLPQTTRRRFTTTPSQPADPPKPDAAIASLAGLSNQFTASRNRAQRNTGIQPVQLSAVLDSNSASFLDENFGRNLDANPYNQKPYRLHIYAHKHNTHITLVQPIKSAADTASSRVLGAKVTSAEQKKQVDTLLSLSAGNIGFRKAGRGSYDAAFQLAAFAMKQMKEKGMLGDMMALQVVLRGFGAGREAVTKALLGTEGRYIRGKITSVQDATRLKQGGPRAKKPRRLG